MKEIHLAFLSRFLGHSSFSSASQKKVQTVQCQILFVWTKKRVKGRDEASSIKVLELLMFR